MHLFIFSSPFPSAQCLVQISLLLQQQIEEKKKQSSTLLEKQKEKQKTPSNQHSASSCSLASQSGQSEGRHRPTLVTALEDKYIDVVKQACQELDKAELYEQCHEVYQVSFPFFSLPAHIFTLFPYMS